MARTIRSLLVGLSLVVTASLNAQVPSQSGAVDITLGQASAPLYGPWKFTIGDSPVDPKTGKPLWAERDFDDSKWETVDLTPQPGESDPTNGDSRYVSGWTARGHAGYMGWAWYRLRITVAKKPGDRIAISAPLQVEDGYQVFANGTLVGSLGKFGSKGELLDTYFPVPGSYVLPVFPGKEKSDTELTIAFRVWLGPAGFYSLPESGGLHYAPVLGAGNAIEAQLHMDWDESLLMESASAIDIFIFLILAILAASLILFDRSDQVYLWIAGTLLMLVFNDAISTIIPLFTDWIDQNAFILLTTAVFTPLYFSGWVMVWWKWFHLQSPAWVPASVAAVTVALMACNALGSYVFATVFSHPVREVFTAGSFVLRVLILGLMCLVVTLGIRMDGIRAWLVLPAVLPSAINLFSDDLFALGLPILWHPFGVTIFFSTLANLLLVAALVILMLRRSLQSLKRQRQMAVDVKEAQEVQQIILPEQHIVLPGLKIESEYRPAREVGGDFFQVIPLTDDNLLIVAGDVAGKGLKAGMLVALLVGAIRTAVETDPDPASVLGALNRRLLGRGDARATCLALRIERDGAVTLANAGHLPPYINGEPIEIEGSLPLGLLEKFDCTVLKFRMSPSDRLLVLSDGVAEATNDEGTLFGFDRVLELVRTQPSAEQIAETAQAFGQEDDISVISVTRMSVAEPMPA